MGKNSKNYTVVTSLLYYIRSLNMECIIIGHPTRFKLESKRYYLWGRLDWRGIDIKYLGFEMFGIINILV